MNIVCFDAFGDLIEYMLEPLSRCSFIFDIKWNWKSIVWWWRWCSWWAVGVSTTTINTVNYDTIYVLDEIWWWMTAIAKVVSFPPGLFWMLQWSRYINNRLRFQPFFKSPISILTVLEMSLMNNHEYGIVPFVTSWKPHLYLHMNVPCSVDCNFLKKTRNQGRDIRSSERIANRYLVFK